MSALAGVAGTAEREQVSGTSQEYLKHYQAYMGLAHQRTQTSARTRKILSLSRTNYWRQAMANGWTSERRAKQAELIKTWKPCEQATGPVTPEGRARVASNAWKGGHRATLRMLVRLVNAEIKAAQDAVESARN